MYNKFEEKLISKGNQCNLIFYLNMSFYFIVLLRNLIETNESFSHHEHAGIFQADIFQFWFHIHLLF